MVVAITGLVVSGCGWSGSSLNPSNWFGGSTEVNPEPVDAAGAANPLMPEERTGSRLFGRPEEEDRSVPIQKVTELRVEPTPSGAIIYAVGVAQRQGAFSAALIADVPEGEASTDTLTLIFQVVYPESATAIGSEATRTVHAARHLSVDEVNAIRTIRVVGAENARETRRR